MSDFDLIDRAKHSVLNRHLCRCGWQGDDIITHVIDLLGLKQVAPFDKATHAHGCWYRAGGPCDCTLKHSKLYRIGRRNVRFVK